MEENFLFCFFMQKIVENREKLSCINTSFKYCT